MKKKLIVSACALALLSSCAKRPDAIAAVDIPVAAYSGLDCIALSEASANEQRSLAALSKQQTDAANGDAMGVFLIGVPLSSAGGGDREAPIAASKGRLLAIEGSARQKGCRSSYFADPTLRK